MIRYEALFLTVPEITADEISAIESQFEKVVKEHQGSVISFERWGKYFLSYEVRNNEYGVYFLARYETAEQNLKALNEALKIMFAVKYADLVMRHMIARLDAKDSLAYQRPESLEEAPSRENEGYSRDAKAVHTSDTDVLGDMQVEENAA